MIWRTLLLLSVLISSLNASAADSARRAATLLRDSTFYSSSDLKSQVLGTLRKGESVKVFYPARKGFYAIYLTTSIKHSHYGWIPAQMVQIGKETFDPPTTLETRRDEIGIFGRYSSISPSEYETAAGGASTSIKSLGVGVLYTHRMSRTWLWEVQFNYFSANPNITGTSASSIFFNYSGFDLIINLEKQIYESGDFSLWAGAGIGFSLMSFTSPPFPNPTDATQTTQLKESSTTAIPFILKLQARYSLPEDFAVFMDLGYEIKSISSLAYSENSDGSYNSAKFSMSSPVISLGLTYAL